jgi:hypothetical protein
LRLPRRSPTHEILGQARPGKVLADNTTSKFLKEQER